MQAKTKPTRPATQVLLLAFGLLASTAALAQLRYAVNELPLLPGSAQCTATGVNDMSEVVGHCAPATENWNQTAVVWRQGTVVSLGKWRNGTYAQGTVINNFGRVAGHADTGNLRPQGWVTLGNDQWVNFFPNSSGNTYPLFVGDNGWVGGYYIQGSKGLWTAAIWRPDAKDPKRYRLEAFPHLPGASDPRSIQSLAQGFNRAGVGVGQSAHDGGARAVLWRNDAKHTLEVLPAPLGGEASIANAVNDLGQVVGEGGRPGYIRCAPGAVGQRQCAYRPLSAIGAGLQQRPALRHQQPGASDRRSGQLCRCHRRYARPDRNAGPVAQWRRIRAANSHRPNGRSGPSPAKGQRHQ